MKTKNILRFVGSLVLFPMISVSTQGNLVNMPQVDNKAPQATLVQKFNISNNLLSFGQSKEDKEVFIREQKFKIEADAIDTYFSDRDMPLAGQGMKMVIEAEKNDIDWRLLPAIAVRESTGGKYACIKAKHNPFGWGSCKFGFKSIEEAIETVARNLGGNHPKTAYHYDEKTTKQILQAYNPPSVVPRYAEQVMKIMEAIGPAEVVVTTNITT